MENFIMEYCNDVIKGAKLCDGQKTKIELALKTGVGFREFTDLELLISNIWNKKVKIQDIEYSHDEIIKNYIMNKGLVGILGKEAVDSAMKELSCNVDGTVHHYNVNDFSISLYCTQLEGDLTNIPKGNYNLVEIYGGLTGDITDVKVASWGVTPNKLNIGFSKMICNLVI